MATLLLIPLEDTVVFPTMDVTLPVDVGDEERVLLVPRHDGEYASVGTIARVTERVRLPGGARGAMFEGVARGIAGAAEADAQGRLRVEVTEHRDRRPAGHDRGTKQSMLVARRDGRVYHSRGGCARDRRAGSREARRIAFQICVGPTQVVGIMSVRKV